MIPIRHAVKRSRAIRNAGLLCLALAALPVAAQAQDEGAAQRRIDSLQRVVEDLTARVRELEHKAPKPHETHGAPKPHGPHGPHPHEAPEPRRAPVPGPRGERARYFNIGYVSERLTLPQNAGKLRSDVGASLSWGRTYYLHRKPLPGTVRIGLDWTWLDAIWTKYDLSYGGWNAPGPVYPYEDDRDDAHMVDLGMAVGPSVTVNPIGELKICVYGRIAPSCALTIYDEETTARYATYFSAGGAVSWNAISVGIEGRWGKIRNAFPGEDDDRPGPHGTRDLKTRAGAMRLYLGFRF